jgi:hypothetical protein
MAAETNGYGKRLRDLEAFAFSTGNTLAKHGELLAGPNSASDSTDAPAGRSIGQRLDAIEHTLSALARAQGIDPDAAD